MKYLFIALAIFISGCSCCGEEVQLPDKIETNTRWTEIKELRIDGRTLPLTLVYDGLYTAYGILKDSNTGKSVTVQAVVKTKDTTGKQLSNPSVDLSLYSPKDSVKTTDTTITKETIKKVKTTFLEYLEEFRWIILSIVALIIVVGAYKLFVRNK